MNQVSSGTQYLFKVNLKGHRSIWRTVVVRGDQTLDELHEVIFSAFDRYDDHLYSFYFPKASPPRSDTGPRPKQYMAPQGFEPAEVFGIDRPNSAAAVRLDELNLKVAQTFEYLFDFGDEWWHEIRVEAISPSESTWQYPRILDKKGASPPQYADVDG